MGINTPTSFPNPTLSEELRIEIEHLKATDPDEYEYVYEGMCRQAVAGAVYKNDPSSRPPACIRGAGGIRSACLHSLIKIQVWSKLVFLPGTNAAKTEVFAAAWRNPVHQRISFSSPPAPGGKSVAVKGRQFQQRPSFSHADKPHALTAIDTLGK